MKRVLSGLLMAGGLALLAWFAIGFPWSHTLAALEGANWMWLGVAAVANVASLVAKGWGWHLLLKVEAPHRWRTAQAATLVGAAVGSLGFSVTGEAARLRWITVRGEMPPGPPLRTIITGRVIEAVGLLLCVAAGASLLPATPWARTLQITAIVTLAAAAVLSHPGRSGWITAWLPAGARDAMTRSVRTMQSRAGGAALALAVINWMAQWTAYHMAFVALGIAAPLRVALTGLIVANLGGILRLTPGNVGVLQASLVVAALPFGIHPDAAVAAGLALQGIQVLPVLAIGVLIAGADALRRLVRRPAAA